MRFEVLKEGAEHQILTHRGKIYFILIRLRQVLKQRLHLNQGCVQSYFTRIEFHPKGTSTLKHKQQRRLTIYKSEDYHSSLLQ